MSLRPPVPATVIGGYLGAGKTTLVNRLLREAAGRRIAVLVNDFGEVSIDAALIEGADGQVLSLAGGCVCCAFGADLVGTLRSVLARVPAPDHVLIETSGVALPAAVARTARLVPGLLLEGIVVLADAQAVRETAQDRYVGETVRQQLADADLLLLSKADLVDAAAREALADWLRALAPAAPVVEAAHGQGAAALVLGLPVRCAAPGAEPAHAARPLRAAPAATPAAELFEHGIHRFDAPVDVPALAARLTAAGSGVLRAKGLLRAQDGSPVLLQVVGRRATVTSAPAAGAADGALAPVEPAFGSLVWIALKGTAAALTCWS